MKVYVIWTSFLFLLFFLAQPNQANDTLLLITSDKEIKKVNNQLDSLITSSKANNLDLFCELINTQFPTYLTEKSSSSTQDEMVLEEDLSRIPNMPTKSIGSALLQLVKSKKNNKLYTLMVLDSRKQEKNIFQNVDKKGVKQVVNNIYMINSIKSNHAVHLHNCFQSSKKISLLFSHTLYTTSNLAMMIKEKKENFEENFVQKVAYSLAEMIDNFEENKISISRLRIENIQIDNEGNAFLIDLSPCYILLHLTHNQPIIEPEFTDKVNFLNLVVILKTMLFKDFFYIDGFPSNHSAKRVLEILLNIEKYNFIKLKSLFEQEWPLKDSENQLEQNTQDDRIFKQVLIKKIEKWRRENPQKILTSINDLTAIPSLPNYFAAKDNVDIRTDGTKIYAVKTMDIAEIVENKLIGETNRLISEIVKLKSQYFAELELLDATAQKIYLVFDMDSSVQVNKFFYWMFELMKRRFREADKNFAFGQVVYFRTLLALATKQLLAHQIFDLEINEFNVRFTLNGNLKIFPLAFQKREEIISNENEKEITNIYTAPIVTPHYTENNESLYVWSIGVFIYIWNYNRNPKIVWKKKNECAISEEQFIPNSLVNQCIQDSVNFDYREQIKCYKRMLYFESLNDLMPENRRFKLNSGLSMDESTTFIDTNAFYTDEKGHARCILHTDDSIEFESKLWNLRQHFDNNYNVYDIDFKNQIKKYDKYLSTNYVTYLGKTSLTVKVIKMLQMKNDMKEDAYRKIYNELLCHRMLAADDSTLEQKSIAKLHGFDWTNENVYMFFELMADLKNVALFMRKDNNDQRTFYELNAGQFLVSMVEAVKFAHTRKIVFNDLNLDHFWLNDDSHVKLADLSDCRFTDKSYFDSFDVDKEKVPSLHKLIEEYALEEEDQNWKQLGLIALQLFFDTSNSKVQKIIKNTAEIEFNKDLPALSEPTIQFLKSLLAKKFNRKNAQETFINFKTFIEKNINLAKTVEKLENLHFLTDQEASSSKSAKKKNRKNSKS